MTHHPRILIVDCHEDVLLALERAFEDAGFQTEIVWSVAEAVPLLERVAFDLLLLNDYLNEGTAEAVLRALRRRGIGTPCLLLQPSAPPMLDLQSFRALGVIGVASKHDYRELLQHVRGYLQAAGRKRELQRATA